MTMETTKTSDTLLESAKMAEKWMNESSAAVMEIYNKQLNLASGYYTNYINSIWSNGKVPGGSQQFLDNYFGNKMAKFKLKHAHPTDHSSIRQFGPRWHLGAE